MQWLKKVIDLILNILKQDLEKPTVVKPEIEAKAERPKPNAVTRPNNPINEKWYPLAQQVNPKMSTQGSYAKGHPEGAIVHFTSGRDKTTQDALGTLAWGREQGFAFFVIAPDGTVFQAHDLTRWGYHGGESKWPGIGSGVSSKLVGIEVACAGSVNKSGNLYKPWFNATYQESEVRYVTEKDHECPTGFYRKYTQEQEESLVELLLWLKDNNPEVFNFDYVLGHHEVSGKKGIGYWRKSDPGGSLSMPMSKFREHLKTIYKSRD